MTFSIVAPARPQDAVDLLAAAPAEEVAVLAGGTDLLLDIDDGWLHPKRVVSLRRLPWAKLEWRDRTLVIGSTLPLRNLESDARLRREIPGLWEAVHAVGGVPLRHRATLGGNLGRASPASDLLPILLALGARVGLFGPGGRREFPVDAFVKGSRKTVLQPGELIESVSIPEPLPSTYLWQRVRPANDISQVGVAVAASPTPPFWRLALGGIVPRARRLIEAERLLLTPTPSEVEIELAAQEAAQRAPFITDKRASEGYRRRLVAVLSRRAIRTTLERRAAVALS